MKFFYFLSLVLINSHLSSKKDELCLKIAISEKMSLV